MAFKAPALYAYKRNKCARRRFNLEFTAGTLDASPIRMRLLCAVCSNSLHALFVSVAKYLIHSHVHPSACEHIGYRTIIARTTSHANGVCALGQFAKMFVQKGMVL